MSTDEALSERAAREMCGALGETQPGAIQQIERIVRRQGIEWAKALQSEAAQIEAQGGMLRPDGQRRTPGGAFLYLAYRHLKPARAAVHPMPTGPSRAQPLAWADRLEAVGEAAQAKGQVMGVKIELTGRPGGGSRRNDTVVLVLEDSHFGSLPKTVPSPPPVPTTYVVYAAARQWSEIEQAIKNPGDVLIINGYCAYDDAVKGISVFATHVTTKLTKMGSRRPAAGPARRPIQAQAAFQAPPAPRPETRIPPAPAAATKYRKGQKVNHPQFGVGEVVDSRVTDRGEEVYVGFEGVGLKRLSADAPGLEVAE